MRERVTVESQKNDPIDLGFILIRKIVRDETVHVEAALTVEIGCNDPRPEG